MVMFGCAVYLMKDNNVFRCGEKTDKGDASHHFILLQSHSKTIGFVNSGQFLLVLRTCIKDVL